jgi:hypothetical protein
MSKILGYLLAIVGIMGVAIATVPQANVLISLPQIGDNILIGISILIAGLGIFMIVKGGSGGKQPVEVPIFKGKHVVGYRRQK